MNNLCLLGQAGEEKGPQVTSKMISCRGSRAHVDYYFKISHSCFETYKVLSPGSPSTWLAAASKPPLLGLYHLSA